MPVAALVERPCSPRRPSAARRLPRLSGGFPLWGRRTASCALLFHFLLSSSAAFAQEQPEEAESELISVSEEEQQTSAPLEESEAGETEGEGGEEVPLPEDPDSVELPPLPATDLDTAQGLPLQLIEITGLRRITASDIQRYLRLKVGSAFDAAGLQRDVRELWRSGYFEDIEVDLRTSESGVSLRFHVKERAAILNVQFEGNDEIDDDDLAEAIEVKPETILNRPALGRSIQKIRNLYAEKGYFLAEASVSVVAEKNNEVSVKFTIKENSQVTVKRVTFIGNEHIPTAELKGIMYTGNPGIMAFGSGGPFRQDAFERDIAMISAMYYDRGFLQVSVNTPRVMLTPDKSGIEVSVTLEEGPRYKIRQLRIYEADESGAEVEPLEGRRALRLLVRAEGGDYFNRAQLLDDLSAVRALYRNAGYANVSAEPQMNVDPVTHEVDVVIPVQRGPLVHFERIEMRGNTKTRDRVIRRELEIIEGAKYSEYLLNRSRARVTALGYFERVDISTEQGSAPDRLTVYVDVTEKPTGTFQVGAGFSSIESFIATAQVQQANLFGNGQSVSLQAQFSGLRQMANLRFIEPYFLESKFSMSVDLFDQLRRYYDFAQRSQGGAITFGYPLVQPEVNVAITYSGSLDQVTTESNPYFLGIGNVSQRISAFSRLPLANLFNHGFTSSLRPSISYDTRDNRLFPTSGVYLNVSSEWATSALGSENEFIRNRWTGRFYVPIYKGLVLKLNTEAGVVTSPRAEGVPIFARFFLGGILDLRGYRFRTVGPRMPLTSSTDPNSQPTLNGVNIGGNLMYYQNLELEFPLFEAVGLKAVLFTDLGNSWNLEGNYCNAAGGGSLYPEVSPCFRGLESLAHMRTSWGFGLRWFSPLGPLRFEWGFPFKPLPYEEPSVFEFTIGNFF